ncbi:hypothetical protein [Caballeronia zhejiangensis]|uniref:Nuclease n=1 Tax=Caballeronia zhejiangensis TaxID=871203 RepID=A0A656QAE6_9BURK|nr:hypothetical protein [Caballeronia zhejiangensis]KDR25939.1 nuclease [Caballeronia zhejiangensis]
MSATAQKPKLAGKAAPIRRIGRPTKRLLSPSGQPKARRVDREFLEQSALFTWARNPAVTAKYPELELMSCSLNGVKLSKAQAGKAKASGMLKGEHDIRLPVARGRYHGLSIEMKYGDNRPTPEQKEYGRRLEEQGWRVHYCWSWTEAREAIIAYLTLPFFSF